MRPVFGDDETADGARAGNTTPLTLPATVQSNHQEVLNRQRRVILNNDGCDVLYVPEDEEITPETILERRTSPLPGTHVDSVFYCTIGSGFGYFTHDTEVGHVLERQPPDYFPEHEGKINATCALIDQGTDILEVMTTFCRNHDIEIFWSMRMNDVHDASHRPDDPHMLFSPIKENHPEYLMGTYDAQPPFGQWSAVDYTHQEVRDFAFRFIQEVCEGYDVDGVELDFFRHLHYFKTVSEGGSATREELDMMTNLVRRVREMAVERACERGRPILLAVRVPDDVEYCRRMGFDIERWLAEDLVDIVIGSGYFRLNHLDRLVELGHRYGAKVYPAFSESRLDDVPGAPADRNDPRSYRGRACQAWTSGADGVYLFNFFDPTASLLDEIGEPHDLADCEKAYFVTVRNNTATRGYSHPARWLADGDEHVSVPILSPEQPLTVDPSNPASLELCIGGDCAGFGSFPVEAAVTCYFHGSDTRETLSVTVNGVAQNMDAYEEGWTQLPLSPSILRQGANRFRFTAEEPVEISDLIVTVSPNEVVASAPSD